MTRQEAKAIVLLLLVDPDPPCMCGMLLSEHGMTDNHGFVEMNTETGEAYDTRRR